MLTVLYKPQSIVKDLLRLDRLFKTITLPSEP